MKETEITRTFTLRIAKDLYKIIEEVAEREERSVNYMMNKALKEYFKYETKEK